MVNSDLTKKLSEIQTKLKAPKGQFNKFGNYKYRSAEDIMSSIKPFLNGISLVVSDEIVLIGERYYVKACAKLMDGENYIQNFAYAREPLEQRGMAAPQVTGSASSYARKYALAGLFLLDDNKDPDSQDNREEAPKKHVDLLQEAMDFKINGGMHAGKTLKDLSNPELKTHLEYTKENYAKGAPRLTALIRLIVEHRNSLK